GEQILGDENEYGGGEHERQQHWEQVDLGGEPVHSRKGVDRHDRQRRYSPEPDDLSIEPLRRRSVTHRCLSSYGSDRPRHPIRSARPRQDRPSDVGPASEGRFWFGAVPQARPAAPEYPAAGGFVDAGVVA